MGIHSNWFWWALAMGNICTVFFFAHLWRRTEAITDIEFLAQRYQPSKAVSWLRIFKVFNDGVLINCVIIASITLAMSKIIKVQLHLTDTALFSVPLFGDVTSTALLLLILGAAILLFTVLSGLYGVVYLDSLQFLLAMAGSIGLAIIVYIDASKGEGLLAKIQSSPAYKPDTLNFFPNLSTFNLLAFNFFVYIFMVWWATAPGGYFFVQRLLATRSERDSVLAFLWFNICHYIVRTWPWVLVGVASMYYIPELKDRDSAFPMMIDKFLPVGLKGIMIASLVAAFTSSVNTLLNWGTSYIVNDFYRPFVVKNKNPRHYVIASQVAMVLLTICALIVTTKLSGILEAYKYIAVIMGGIGTVLVARWYWWRVNAYSEIAAIVSCFFIGNFFQLISAERYSTFFTNLVRLFNPGAAAISYPESEMFGIHLVLTVLCVTPIWVIVTLLTSREPSPKSIEFYSKMKISGPGWKKVAAMTGISPIRGEFKRNLIGWLSCVVFILGLMLFIGKLLFLQWTEAAVLFVIVLVSGIILKNTMSKMKFLSKEG
jgi:solute:Na+ symporter, SSS family